jgi:hypothetical protein
MECSWKKTCIYLSELDISVFKDDDIDRFLNDFSLKKVYKLRFSSIHVNKESIKKVLKSLDYESIIYLRLDVLDMKWDNLFWDVKNFINKKSDLNILESFTIEGILTDKISKTDILNLSKLKVENLVFLWSSISSKYILSILQNSEYLHKIIVSDGVKYNGEKAFYFVKRNWKIYIYDNAKNQLN